jgi:hypothetical protein
MTEQIKWRRIEPGMYRCDTHSGGHVMIYSGGDPMSHDHFWGIVVDHGPGSASARLHLCGRLNATRHGFNLLADAKDYASNYIRQVFYGDA